MECPSCKNQLMVAGSKYSSSLDSTDVFSELVLVCINPKCANYAGADLNKPKKIATTVKNKVN